MGGCSLDLEVGIYLSWSSYSIMNRLSYETDLRSLDMSFWIF